MGRKTVRVFDAPGRMGIRMLRLGRECTGGLGAALFSLTLSLGRGYLPKLGRHPVSELLLCISDDRGSVWLIEGVHSLVHCVLG